MLRKIRRNALKIKLGTNNISEEFHKIYGSTPIKIKMENKIEERRIKKERKFKHKKARLKKTK